MTLGYSKSHLRMLGSTLAGSLHLIYIIFGIVENFKILKLKFFPNNNNLFGNEKEIVF